MTSTISYRSTILACYVANFVGAIVINLTPILFIPLKLLYNLSYTQFGILLATNYITQLAADFLFSWPTDKYGYRPFTVLAPILTIAGYWLFALAPVLDPVEPFRWFLAGTILFSATGGLLELLLSAIINGIPSEQKATLMSVLHSFYAWGQLIVVLLTTLGVWYLGAEKWQWLVIAWSILPFCNVIQFLFCPLPPQVPEEKQGYSHYLSTIDDFEKQKSKKHGKESLKMVPYRAITTLPVNFTSYRFGMAIMVAYPWCKC